MSSQLKEHDKLTSGLCFGLEKWIKFFLLHSAELGEFLLERHHIWGTRSFYYDFREAWLFGYYWFWLWEANAFSVWWCGAQAEEENLVMGWSLSLISLHICRALIHPRLGLLDRGREEELKAAKQVFLAKSAEIRNIRWALQWFQGR